MEYLKGKQFMGDFASRTLTNLKVIEDNVSNNKQVYEVTQLINSLLGLIVLPSERGITFSNDSILSNELMSYIEPQKQYTDEQLFRCLRHTVAHWHIYFEKDPSLDQEGKAKIKSVIFVNCNYKQNKSLCKKNKDCIKYKLQDKTLGEPDFVLKIPVNELRACVEKIAQKIVDNYGG